MRRAMSGALGAARARRPRLQVCSRLDIARDRRRLPTTTAAARRSATTSLQGLEIGDHVVAVLDADQVLLAPLAQMLVHALARHADHVAELLLRELEVDPHAVARPGCRTPRRGAPGAWRGATGLPGTAPPRAARWSGAASGRAPPSASGRHPDGRAGTGRKSRRSSTSSSQSSRVTASAVRSAPSSSAISPNTSPGLNRFSTSSLPSSEWVQTFTRPRSTTIMLVPGSPLRNSTVRRRWRATRM